MRGGGHPRRGGKAQDHCSTRRIHRTWKEGWDKGEGGGRGEREREKEREKERES